MGPARGRAWVLVAAVLLTALPSAIAQAADESDEGCWPQPACRGTVPPIAPGDGVAVVGIPIGFTVPVFATIEAQDAAKPRIVEWLTRFEEQVEAFINNGLGDKKFDDCVRFSVDVHVKFLVGYPVSFADLLIPGGGEEPEPGPLINTHRILLNDNPAFRSVTHTASRTGDSTLDDAKAFDFYSTGEWALHGMGPRDYAHEVMHLLGLGDDYRSVYGVNGEFLEAIPLPGREGTLMDSGPEIDQELVDRLGKMLREAGLLPNCWVASAPMVRSVVATAGGTCSDAWRMDFSFIEAADGTLSGEGTGDPLGDWICDPPIPGGGPATHIAYTVEGQRDGDTFILAIVPQTGTGGVGMAALANPEFPRRPMTIPMTGDRGSVDAAWTWSTTNPDGSVVNYETSGRFTIECRTCALAVG